MADSFGLLAGGVLVPVTDNYVLAFVFVGMLWLLAAASAFVGCALGRRPVEVPIAHA